MKYLVTLVVLVFLASVSLAKYTTPQAPPMEPEQAPNVQEELKWFEHETGGYGLWEGERLVGYWDGKSYYPLKDGKWLLPLGMAPIKAPRVIRVLNSTEGKQLFRPSQMQPIMRMSQPTFRMQQPMFQMAQPMFQPSFNFSSRASGGCST